MTTTDTPRLGATAVSARSLAPDLARGAMLLLIALANAHLYLYGHPVGVRGYPVPGPVVDRLVVLLQMTLVDGRAYPMFALLFGYGTVQLLRRLTGGGVDRGTVRALVRRRGWWMILFGSLHALLLFSGDILGAYGLLAVLLAGLLIRASDRTLLIMAAGWSVLAAALGVLQALPAPEGTTAILPSMSLTDPLLAAWSRAAEWLILTVAVSLFGLVPALLLGVWAARRRILDEPERYRPLLVRVAVLGVALAAAGGLPIALMAASWWPEPSLQALLVAGAVHTLTGYAGGVGYAAIAGLVAIRVRERGRRGPVVTALTACGQRSLTCYLLQSVAFVTVLAAYGGGLGNRWGLAATALFATATWALTVLLAGFMRRRGYRGPAEVLLRRLTYGPRSMSGQC
ncbi:MAG TPA: DUF418 domain-containing protein [Pseudonocardiaceae bacterium]|nr:DUF418 domain-containing protein [Pseudonocardiaceae bacterium]